MRNLISWLGDRFNNFADVHTAKWEVFWVSVATGIILSVGLYFLVTVRESLSRPSIASALAASVVGLFAIVNSWHARRQVSISNRAIEIALNSELNRAAPVIKLTAQQRGAGDIHVEYSNIGGGPALNVECWLNNEELPHLLSSSNRRNETAIGVGESGDGDWAGENELPEFRLGADVIAQYEDIFKRVFESRLEFVSNGPPILHYGRVVNQAGDKRLFR